MDACCREKLQEQSMEVPENITRDIPDWASKFSQWYWPLCPASKPSRCRICAPYPREVHPSRLERSDPKMIPAHDRDIHLVELKYCPDTHPLPSLQKAADQHA
eukprot:529382-Pelagomonas_calceolata.AAC.1